MPDMKRSIKDSMFSFIFEQPEYMRKLYLSIHPEDKDVEESDLKLVTLANILTTGIYNDLGILVRDKLILMVEAQSTFSENLALRLLMYLAETYKEYVEEHRLNLYSSAAVTVPRPELYVVYTGDKQDVPDVLRLSDLYQGLGHVELEVKVLRGDAEEESDILRQYVRFCKIADQQRKLWGPTLHAVEETIQICLEENILAPLLSLRRKEVSDIMVVLYDQEKVMEIHDYNVAKAAEKAGRELGKQEGKQEGRQEGRQEGIQATLAVLRGFNASVEMATKQLVDHFGLTPEAAAENVKQYWGQ